MGHLDDLPIFEFDVLLVVCNRLLSAINVRSAGEIAAPRTIVTRGR